MSTSLRPKVGLLALTLELYETLAPELRPSREAWLHRAVIPALGRAHDMLFERAVFRRAEIEATVAEYEAAGADALLVILLTYAPSQLTLPALQRCRLPVVIWNTQELQALDATFTLEAMIDNHGVHGTQDLASVLVRSRVPFHYVTSPWDDPAGLAELTDFFAAAAAVRRLRQARIGCLGHPFPGMGDFAVDSTHLVASLGCSGVHVPLEAFLERWSEAKAGPVAALVHQYQQQYSVDREVTPLDLESTARAEIALRGLVTGLQLDALTYQFLAFGEDQRSPTLPFVAASRMMADGIGFAGEGDVLGAAATAFVHWLCPPATFSEIFTIDFAGNTLFMSHMGETNVAMARRDRKVRMAARPTPITRTRHGQLVLVTSLQPGTATLVALTRGPGENWRLLASAVTVDDFGPLPGFYVPHFRLRPQGNVQQFLTAYARAGGPHHNVVCFGDARRRVRLAAGMLRADYLEF